jgi:hypothetical protein
MGRSVAADRGPSSGGLEAACLACDRPLSFLPDSYPLVFRCENGHCLTLRDLLDHDWPRETEIRLDLLESTLARWTARARMLHSLSGAALRYGHALIAADFKEAAGRIDGWTASLLSLRPKPAPPAD